MRDDDAYDDDDDDAVIEAEEAHARAVANHLFSKLERCERVESRATTTATATTSSTTTSSTTTSGDARALAAMMDARAREASALDAARARIRALELERDEARRARGELARKCQRLHARAKIQEMETAKLREALVAATMTKTAAVGSTARLRAPRDALGDGSPESVGFEYHRAVCEAFERKIASLIDELERTRRSTTRPSASASVRDASPPREATDAPRTPATPPRDAADAPPSTIDVAPFTPTMGPLDALLAKIAVVSPR
jgi:hypothetical protein